MVSSIFSIHGETRRLWQEEVLVQTNAGTYGEDECSAKLATRDLDAGVYRIYERVGDGRRRREGCPVGAAPGLAIVMGRNILTAKRHRLARVAKKIQRAAIAN